MEGRDPRHTVHDLEDGSRLLNGTMIVLPNIYEFNRRGIDSAYPESALHDWHTAGRIFADLALFWGGDESIVLTPRPMHPAFVRYIQERFGLRRLVRSPRQDSGRLCVDVLADSALLRELASSLQADATTMVLAYGATTSLYQLINALAAHGVRITTPDIPSRANYWTSLYYDSKAGCRHPCTETAATYPRLHMPEGFICHSLDQAVEYIRYFHVRDMGCVIKANLGVGGLATIVLGQWWSRRSPRVLRRYLHQWAASVPYFFHQGPIIVEQQVVAPAACAEVPRTMSGAISAHGFVNADGQTHVLGTARELRDVTNAYVGAELGKGAISADVATQVESLMHVTGTALASHGYCGHVGIDVLLDAVGTPWLLEVNPRRCSGAHVYDIGTRLFGPNWATTRYALSRLPLEVIVERAVTVEQVLDVLDRVNDLLSDAGVVVIPTCLSGLEGDEPLIGYVVFGTDRQTVLDSERVLLARFAHAGVHRKHREGALA